MFLVRTFRALSELSQTEKSSKKNNIRSTVDFLLLLAILGTARAINTRHCSKPVERNNQVQDLLGSVDRSKANNVSG